MCGRFEERFIYGTAVSIAVLFLFLFQPAAAQELPPVLLRLMEEQGERSPAELEQLMDFYADLLSDPLNLNAVSEERLRECRMLSEFQIRSLLDYRRDHGRIVSFLELSLIDGFSRDWAALLRPIAVLGPLSESDTSSHLPRPRYELLVKARKNLSPSMREFHPLPSSIPFYLYLRYRMKQSGRLQVGFTLENDDGEVVFPDFTSAYLQILDRPLGRQVRLTSLILGDYSLRLGQGLVLWNTFSMNSLSEPSSVLRSASGAVPYTSSGECDFFRGVSAAFSWKDRLCWGVSLSRRRKDAHTEGEAFLSLPSDGLHRTASGLASRARLREDLLGLYCRYSLERFRIGINLALYGYDHRDARPDRDDLRYQRIDGPWGNLSLDLLYSFQGRRYFLEAALDRKAAFAILAGGLFRLGAGVELSCVGRWYPKDYVAPLAGAMSVNSQVANEAGLQLNLKCPLRRRWVLRLGADAAYNPWYRYRIPPSSWHLKVQGDLSFRIHPEAEGYVRILYRWRSYDRLSRVGIKLDYRREPQNGGWMLHSRLEVVAGVGKDKAFSGAVAAFQELGYVHHRLSAFFRLTAFRVDDWENRIYCYERDLPHSFSVPALYGRGFGLFLLFQAQVGKNMDFGIKVSQTIHPRERKRNASGFRMQYRIRF